MLKRTLSLALAAAIAAGLSACYTMQEEVPAGGGGGLVDTDRDGIPNSRDEDDDDDGILDLEDNDDDNDGVLDTVDDEPR